MSTQFPPASPPDPSQPGSDADATMDSTPTIAPVDALPPQVTTYPLHPVDPPKIGDFWPSARLVAAPSGVAYLAYEDNGTAPVMVILLSQGASADPAARDRLAGQVDRMDIDTVIARGGLDQDTGRMGGKFRSEADDPQGVDALTQSPWVALAFDQTQAAVDEARRVLAEVDLTRLPSQGDPSGPDYRLHWADRVAPGLTRVWPLPWPGRRERGGRLSILASWLLMFLLGAIAVLIAILLFSQAPPTPPPPPIPPTAQSASPSSESPPPSTSPSPSQSPSGSPSPSESASPSPTPSGSPSPSETVSPSLSPSPSPTPSPSPIRTPGPSGPTVGGSPTPPSRL
ncbi:MAG: hypothetical protein FWD75_09485 [Propionibacteriaceae bacterium]|nr:hypothetical protein [Propionibacteriaceae bacterium]